MTDEDEAIEQITQAREEQYASAVIERDLMQDLLSNKGWKLLAENFSNKAKAFERELREPIKADELYLQEFRKGVFKAIHEFLNFPQKVIDTADDIIEGLDNLEIPAEPELPLSDDDNNAEEGEEDG